jgi:hypothetical protein
MSKFTRELIAQLRTEINAALQTIGTKHNLKLKVAQKVKVFEANATFQLEASTVTNDGRVMTKEAQAFLEVAPRLGLLPEHLGRMVPLGDRWQKLVGYNPKAERKPFLMENYPGQVRAWPAEPVIKALKELHPLPTPETPEAPPIPIKPIVIRRTGGSMRACEPYQEFIEDQVLQKRSVREIYAALVEKYDFDQEIHHVENYIVRVVKPKLKSEDNQPQD